MAVKKQKKDTLDFSALTKKLRDDGPARVYLLHGEEDYLRESFIDQLRKICAVQGDDMNHRRLNGETVTMPQLGEAVDAMPFLSDRTLVEVRDFDVNKRRETQADELMEILSDVPEYCTVVLLLPHGIDPDGRLSIIKSIKKIGEIINFTQQGNQALVGWISRRFSALGKKISRADAEYLIFISGALMSGLIPEIEKVANYASSDVITRSDIDSVAHHLPEARVFEMTEKLAARDFDGSVRILSELLQMKDEPPIKILAVVGKQIRNLYAARVAIDRRLGRSFVMETCAVKLDFVADRLINSARGFSTAQLRSAVRLCAETDFRMKSSSEDDTELLRELVLRIAAGEK